MVILHYCTILFYYVSTDRYVQYVFIVSMYMDTKKNKNGMKKKKRIMIKIKINIKTMFANNKIICSNA